jgi:hypothetical protein
MDKNTRSSQSDYDDYDSVHGTDHYIMTWDQLFTEPGDVYVGKNDAWLADQIPADDLGEEYPRGV